MRALRRPFAFFIAALLVLAGALFLLPARNFTVEYGSLLSGLITKDPPAERPVLQNPFTGLPCEGEALPRPISVMLAGDSVTRPLSGIAAADLVVEMPVITDGINRFLAVYVCPSGGPDAEIGSIRSARDDYLPLAAAFDAIYAHWGGSHFALDALRGGTLDEIDALRNPYGAYFRKRGITAPHNGFTTLTRLRNTAVKLGYRMTLLEGFSSSAHGAAGEGAPAFSVAIGYPGPYRVEWRYDDAQKRYLRWRGGSPEQDKVGDIQVTAGTLVAMRTTSRQIEGQYNDVRVTGSGEATVYRSGAMISGRWEKAAPPFSAPLRFLDERGEPISFSEGPVWIEIVQQDTIVETLNANL